MRKILFKCMSLLMAIALLAAQNHSLSAKTIITSTPSIEESALIFDQGAFDLVFGELNELDNYLALNEGVTYADLQAAGSELIANVSDVSAPLGQSEKGNGELPLGIPAFWWGCILGWVGLLLVYLFTDKDKEQTKKALTGCLISTGVSLVISIVYYVWLYNELDAWY